MSTVRDSSEGDSMIDVVWSEPCFAADRANSISDRRWTKEEARCCYCSMRSGEFSRIHWSRMVSRRRRRRSRSLKFDARR